MKKKTLALVLSTAMVMGLTAAGAAAETVEGEFTIGISQFAEH